MRIHIWHPGSALSSRENRLLACSYGPEYVLNRLDFELNAHLGDNSTVSADVWRPAKHVNYDRIGLRTNQGHVPFSGPKNWPIDEDDRGTFGHTIRTLKFFPFCTFTAVKDNSRRVGAVVKAWRREMQVAGIRRVGAHVEMIERGEPRPLAEDEVLLEVRAAGVGNWDEFVRTGGWDVGAKVPMALGVEASGIVLAVGQAVDDWSTGDAVMTHPVPLRDQGSWAPRVIAPARLLARKPPHVSWEVAAAFAVPALTAEQALSEAVNIRPGEQLLVHGAGGVTGGLLVALGVLRGAQVIATAGPASQQRVSALGATYVIDYNDEEWPEQVRAISGRHGVAAAVNAARGGASSAIRAVVDGGRLATITSDPPVQQRGITVSSIYVRADGNQLHELAQHLADGHLDIPIAARYRLADAAQALVQASGGHAGGAIVLTL